MEKKQQQQQSESSTSESGQAGPGEPVVRGVMAHDPVPGHTWPAGGHR